MGNRDRNRGRAPARPSHEPRALPASNGNAAIDVRASGAPAVLQQSEDEKEILRQLTSEKARRAMKARLGQLFGPDEMIAMVSTCLKQSPLLAKCDPLTVIGAVMEVAQVGLRLDRTLGQAYLVPFRNGRRSHAAGRDVYEAQLVLGYRGMITMAEHAERVQAVRAKVVYEKDYFRYEEGLEPILEHRPWDGRDRGKPTHVYSVVHKQGGVATPYVMPWWKIEDLRDAQVKRGNTIWQTNTEEMALKTTIRRGLKYHPLAPRQQRLAILDELAEEGVEQGLDFSGTAALEEIGESVEQLEAAKEAAKNETAAGQLSSPESRGDNDPKPAESSSSAPAAAPADAPKAKPASSSDELPGLSADEEAAFEASLRERENGGKS
jgi:recombination protein RecT